MTFEPNGNSAGFTFARSAWVPGAKKRRDFLGVGLRGAARAHMRMRKRHCVVPYDAVSGVCYAKKHPQTKNVVYGPDPIPDYVH